VSGPRDPWADPSTPTEQGSPYAGPPQAVPGQPYGQPYGQQHPYGAPPWGQPPYGAPPYGQYGVPWTPLPLRPPQRPGQVITAAVLAFVQAAVVLIGSLYLWFFASVADFAVSAAPQGYTPARIDALATEGTALAIVQLLSAVVLVGAGVWSLNARSRGAWRLLVAAHAVQVALAVYWAVRLVALVSEAPGAGGQGSVAGLALFFAAGPLTALGLLLIGVGRQWFAQAPPVPASPAHA
jgi:hypothetical protein